MARTDRGLELLNGFTYSTKLDLASGFHQVEMEGSAKRTYRFSDCTRPLLIHPNAFRAEMRSRDVPTSHGSGPGGLDLAQLSRLPRRHTYIHIGLLCQPYYRHHRGPATLA